eukprot:g7325.t1
MVCGNQDELGAHIGRWLAPDSILTLVGLPVVDVRKYWANKKHNYYMSMTQIVTHPYFMVLFMAVILGLFLFACALVYVPMYASYYAVCVSETDPEGTFVTNTSYKFAYNWASKDYNSAMLEGVSQYDESRSKECTLHTQDSDSNFTGTMAMAVSIEQRIFQLAMNMALFDRCVNATSNMKADIDYWILNQNISKIGPFDMGEVQAREYCINLKPEDAPKMKDSRYNCSELPICNMTCDGPDKEALVAATKDSGCSSEWLFHAGMFRFILSLLVYVCLNISRVLVMTALVRLTWRVLASKGFEFLGTVDRLGNMDPTIARRLNTQVDNAIKSRYRYQKSISPSKVDNVIKSRYRHQKLLLHCIVLYCIALYCIALNTQVDNAIKRYERVAWVLLILAVLAHIPYIVVLQKYGDAV